MRNTHIPVDVDAVGGALGRLTRALLIARSFQTPGTKKPRIFIPEKLCANEGRP